MVHYPVRQLSVAAALCLAALPALGAAPLPLTSPLARPAPAVLPVSTAMAAPSDSVPAGVIVPVRAGVRNKGGRLAFQIDAEAGSPSLRRVSGGVEIRLPGAADLDLSGLRHIRQVAGIEQRREGDALIATVRLTCACDIHAGHIPGYFFVDFRDAREPVSAARLSVAAAAGSAPGNAPPAVATKPAPRGDDMDSLRASLSTKIALLNGVAPAADAAPQSAPAAAPAVPPPPPKPICQPDFDMAAWRGEGSFTERLVALRRQAANAMEGAPEMAALAEFYVANGLPNEALAAVNEWHAEDPSAADRTRLARVADIAHLMRRESIDAASPLLAEHAGCDRDDLGLWRALAATAIGDTQTVVQQAGKARAELRDIPDTPRQIFAMAIADASGDDPGTLRAMAAAVQNADSSAPDDEADRLLLQAKIASSEGNLSDEVLFLGRAAEQDSTVPGLIARMRLAALDASRPGPVGSHAEAVLLDLAHAYRYDPLGEEAALLLAQRRLEEGDYAETLALADQSAAGESHRGESRGAELVARILRILVGPDSPSLPDADQRLTLYWRYEGYATPGAKGDDIRLGAIRLLLARNLPEAALSVANQLSPVTTASPDAMVLRALAEARAATGDPQKALALLGQVPASPEAHRATAAALARLDRADDAAHALDGLPAYADRLRRADLFYQAQDWDAAAAAYADLLRDPATEKTARADLTTRYALTASLARRAPADRPATELLSAQGAARDALSLVDAPPPAASSVAVSSGAVTQVDEVRQAIERSKHIEDLLAP